ncbi:hypothetical protein EJB05_23278, partial [Eragrostis curvula]
MKFYLWVLVITDCPKLKDFAPFQFRNLHSSEVEKKPWMWMLEDYRAELSSSQAEQKEWLSAVRELTIHGCPRLTMLPPLPPAASTKVFVGGNSTDPYIFRLHQRLWVKSSKDLRILDDKILAFKNLTEITTLHIENCPNLASLSFDGFKQLQNLRELAIISCCNLLSPRILPHIVFEDWKNTNCLALPRLTYIKIESCGGIVGKWLSEMLPHAECLEAIAPGCLVQDEFHLHIPLNVCSTLHELYIECCQQMKLCDGKDSFGGFTSLTKLKISNCAMLLSSANKGFSLPPSITNLVIEGLPTKLQPYLWENLTSLKNLDVRDSPDLQYLHLHSCTALEELKIYGCGKLAVLEGFRHLLSLRKIEILSGLNMYNA